ncbi:MAG TPA: hypothetical protein VGB19_03605 [Actinomycetota bacterium]
MRRGMVIGVTLLVIAAGIGIGVGAYHAGVNHGLDQAGRSGEVVRVIDHGYYGGFPFGILIFPLVIIGIFAIVGARRRRWAAMGPGGGYGHWGPGPWGPGGVEDLHRRLHEQESGQTSGSGSGGGGPPTTA